jgi:predicted acylesterase/phospholipase RssA
MIITNQVAQPPESAKTGEPGFDRPGKPEQETKPPRIGLALSGGGFRAAIFHLGVIRRLEELGIMPRVRVISAVSGGSIVSAYYLCEMERRLRLEEPDQRHEVQVRVRVFEEIARDFFQALDNNLRTRALILTPFFHPWLFIKTLALKPFRAGARSELIQAEYDTWFYNKNTLDQLPSAALKEEQNSPGSDFGTRLLINATSLLTGERVAFSRVPISQVNQMSRVNKNVLPLSRVVGASSGVPGLFPPTMISGDVLVDGGVADNQGIESLIDDPLDCNVLLVSDASGQMEPVHSIKQGLVKVLTRINSIFQFQVRNKLLDILVGWKYLPSRDNEPHSFAFIHLHLNLKDRGRSLDRVPSEFIPGIARMRTDLDQFSFIERETLMYHGYTLIDSQIKRYCPELLPDPASSTPAMLTPPLFRDHVLNSGQNRERIRSDLEAGSQNSYGVRCLKKHPRQAGPFLAGAVFTALFCLFLVLRVQPAIIDWVGNGISTILMGIIPDMLLVPLNKALEAWGLLDVQTTISGLSGMAALVAVFFFVCYVITFPAYIILRGMITARDHKIYKDLTGMEPSVQWSPAQETDHNLN